MYGSNGYVYAPGGQGILTGESSEMDVLITAIVRLRHEPVGASLLSLMLADTITKWPGPFNRSITSNVSFSKDVPKM